MEELKGLVNKTDGKGQPDARDVFVQVTNPYIENNMVCNDNGIYDLKDPRTGQSKDAVNQGFVNQLKTDLNNRIDDEVTILQDEIINESMLRSSSVNELQNQIDILDYLASSTSTEIDQEISTRTQQNINEASTRAAADIALQNQIDNLDLLVSSTASEFDDKINYEASTRAEMDGFILNTLNNEISTRSLNDFVQQAEIENLQTEMSSEVNRLTDIIDYTFDEIASSVSAINIELDYKADLVNGLIPVNEIPPEAKEMRYVSNIAGRDAISYKFIGLTVLVNDATADLSVAVGSAVYFCYQVSPTVQWRKVCELDTMDLITSWDHIQNKPVFGTGHDDFARGDSVVNEASTRAEIDNILDERLTVVEDYCSSSNIEFSNEISLLQQDTINIYDELASLSSTAQDFNFLGLTDTPDSYSGQGNSIVEVKHDETGLMFTDKTNLLKEISGSAFKVVEQLFIIGTTGETTFNLDYVPSSEEGVQFFVDGQMQYKGINKDFVVDMDFGNVTWLNRQFQLQSGSEILIRYYRGVEGSHALLNGIIRTIQEPVNKAFADGNNKIFYISKEPFFESVGYYSTLKIFSNGDFQSQGVGNDYTCLGNVITFANAPQNGAKLYAIYDIYNSMTTKKQELLIGDCNAYNKSFSISELPINYENVEIYLSGVFQSQGPGKEYTILGKHIEFVVPPDIGSKVFAVYEINSSNLVIGRVDGTLIDNVGDSNVAVQELIDQRDYEENLNTLSNFECSTPLLWGSYLIQFSTKKRIIPTISLSTISSLNVNDVKSSYVSINGFNLEVQSIGSGIVNWRGMWQAQCASYTKLINFIGNQFTVVDGVAIIDLNGLPTGEYSTNQTIVSLNDVTESVDGSSYVIKTSTNYITIPKNNEEQMVDLLYGLESQHLSAQSLKLVKEKLGLNGYQDLQRMLRNNLSIKNELRKVYISKRIEWMKLNNSDLSSKQLFLINNQQLILNRIVSGSILVNPHEIN